MLLLRRCQPHPSSWQRRLGTPFAAAVPHNNIFRRQSDVRLNCNDDAANSTCRHHLMVPSEYQPARFAMGSSSLALTTHTPFLLNNPVRVWARAASGKCEEFYTQVGGPINRSVCELSKSEIRNLIRARNQCRRERDFQRADKIREKLRRSGVFVDDRSKEWRADGQSFLPGNGPSKDPNKMPRMRDCQTMDEAILALSDNLAKASNRDISAFWAVVPTLLRKRRSGNRHHQSQQLVPQLSSIFSKTAENIGTFGPKDLATTTLAFAKIVDVLDKPKGRDGRGGGPYHDCLSVILVDRKGIIFQFIAKASVPALSQFDARCLSNLAYAYGLIGYLPEFDDGSTLFHHIAEKSILQVQKFKPQELSNTVWAFGKIGVPDPALFEKVGDHIASLRSLDAFSSQDISNTLNAFAKAAIPHPALFERVGDHIVALRSFDAFAPQELSNTVNAFAKTGVPHPALFEKVGDHIVALGSLDEFDPQALSNTVNAFAKAGVSHPALFGKVGDHIVALGSLGSFKPQALSNTLNAYAKAEVPHLPLFEGIGDHIASLGSLDEFKSQELSNTVNAFAKAGVVHSALFERVGDHTMALASLEAFKPQELSNTVWAFAKAGTSHPALFEKVADHVVALASLDAFDPQESMDDWGGQNIANVAWAFQKAGIENVPLSDKLTAAPSKRAMNLTIAPSRTSYIGQTQRVTRRSSMK